MKTGKVGIKTMYHDEPFLAEHTVRVEDDGEIRYYNPGALTPDGHDKWFKLPEEYHDKIEWDEQPSLG